MTVYLLHFYPPLHHAKHYIGFTTDEDALRRSLEHKNGTKKGSPLIRAALAAGCTVKLACVWPGADRAFERKLKKRKKASQFCPCCDSKCKKPLYQPTPKEPKNENENETTQARPVRA